MQALLALAAVAAWLVIHLLAYFIVLRNLRWFRRESSVFAYHAVSALAITLGSVCLVLFGAPASLAVATAALHGIYSMSFLECWSLAEGGYSLSILRATDAATRSGLTIDLAALHRIGASKRDNRIQNLIGLGLGRRDGDRLVLTTLGRIVAAALRAIAWPARLPAGS